MKEKNIFLTMDEKYEMILQGKPIPICVGNSDPHKKNSFISKLRGTIFDGSLKKLNLKN